MTIFNRAHRRGVSVGVEEKPTGDEMSETNAGTFEIHSEARGPHWVAWLTRGDDPKPVLSVLLVGQTREEAEQRARKWTSQVSEYSTS